MEDKDNIIVWSFVGIVLGVIFTLLIWGFLNRLDSPSSPPEPNISAFNVESKDFCDGSVVRVLTHKDTGNKFVFIQGHRGMTIIDLK